MSNQQRTARIEVIVGDPVENLGSMFGHAAIVIDSRVYSRWEEYLDVTREQYFHDPHWQATYRASTGYIIAVTPSEKKIILTEIKRRLDETSDDTDGKTPKDKYSIVTDSCSTHIAAALQLAGISITPIYGDIIKVSGGLNPVTLIAGSVLTTSKYTTMPRDIGQGLEKSGRLVLKKRYPKEVQKPALPSKKVSRGSATGQ